MHAEAGKTLASTSVLKIHRMLRRALKDAVRRGKASRNVCDLIDPPDARPAKVKAHRLEPDGERPTLEVAPRGNPQRPTWEHGRREEQPPSRRTAGRADVDMAKDLLDHGDIRPRREHERAEATSRWQSS
jgi:hypothetical protein